MKKSNDSCITKPEMLELKRIATLNGDDPARQFALTEKLVKNSPKSRKPRSLGEIEAEVREREEELAKIEARGGTYASYFDPKEPTVRLLRKRSWWSDGELLLPDSR
jgi:hypothetical protein